MYSEMSLPADRNWTLEELSREKSAMLVPSIVYLFVLMIAGVAGNVLVISVYYFRFNGSTHRCFILVLASSDLFACAVGVPFSIAESFHAYTYTEHISCRILRFVLYYTCICSSLTLVLIALERFRKICRPLKPQMSISMAKKALVFVNAGIAFVSASPALVLYGRNTIQTGVANMTGTKCFISDTFVDTEWPTVFNIYLLCLAIASTICMSVCYVRVVRKISVVGKENLMKRKSSAGDTSKVRQSAIFDMDVDSDATSACISQTDADLNSQHPGVDGNSTFNGRYSRANTTELSNSIKSNETKSKQRLTLTPSEWASKFIRPFSRRSTEKTLRITRMLVAVTVVFVLSYLPHLTLMLWDMFTETYETLPKDNLYQIIFYSFFLNNLINPFIYASMDPKFRRESKKMFCRKKKQ